ncbi:nucleoside monophosphate kinase [Candidatus Woesearchaeota archaeon]|nr:nucleoside monophosphate kinase [Candidatus Woesearchaeota archaeon]
MKIILLGAPGVGKGTAAGMLARKYGLPHLSTGDLFKEAIRAGTDFGKKIKGIVESGNLIPDTMVSHAVKERLTKPDMKRGYFIDGYPRTVEQAMVMDTFAKPDIVLNFSAGRDTIITRLSGRRVCSKCGAIYNMASNPPKTEGRCNSCGGTLVKRKDDDPAVIMNRLDVYEAQTKPLIQHYTRKGLLADIDSSFDISEMDKILEQCYKAIEKVK